MADPFVAEIRIFAGNFAPRGWALCNGQLLSIAQNTALFSLVGTIYGGNGQTTFALPDLRGRAAVHAGRGPGLQEVREGEKFGVETVTLSEAELANHTHQLVGSSEDDDSTLPTNHAYGALSVVYAPGSSPLVEMASSPTPSLATVGGGQAHNNMQPFVAVNFIIALTGVYPPRS